MTGGNVSSRPTTSRMNAATLTSARATVFVAQARVGTNHETSQTMIATVETPDSVPAGL